MCRFVPDVLASHRAIQLPRFGNPDLPASIYSPRCTGLDYCIRLAAPMLYRGICVCFYHPLPHNLLCRSEYSAHNDRFPIFVIAFEAKLFAIACFFRWRRRNQCASTADAITRAPAAAGAPRHKAQGTRHKEQSTRRFRKIKKRRQTHAVRVCKSGAHASSIHDVAALKPACSGLRARRVDLSRHLRRHSASHLALQLVVAERVIEWGTALFTALVTALFTLSSTYQ